MWKDTIQDKNSLVVVYYIILMFIFNVVLLLKLLPVVFTYCTLYSALEQFE